MRNDRPTHRERHPVWKHFDKWLKNYRGLMMDAYQAFERDVPESLREDAMYAMAVAAQGCESPANVTILDRDRLDAINVRASGIIIIAGVEYTFQIQDGNWNGTELLAWESDKPFEHHEPTRWALQPARRLIREALAAGRGAFLVVKWDAMLLRGEIADIPRNYAYDRHFQQGSKIETHWKEAAAKHHFEIVTESDANETRKRLKGE